MSLAIGRYEVLPVYRWADDVVAGESFLADSVVLESDDAGGPNDQLVAEARCA